MDVVFTTLPFHRIQFAFGEHKLLSLQTRTGRMTRLRYEWFSNCTVHDSLLTSVRKIGVRVVESCLVVEDDGRFIIY